MDDKHSLLRRVHAGLPALQTRNDINPTLLVSWFCTVFSLVVIVIRLLGRWVRTEKLFREDKVMFWSIVPLLVRMALVHMVLIWGTNNTVTTGLTEQAIYHRMIGSKLVLPARILYAAYIWIAKITVLEFLQRLVGQSWIKSYEMGMRIIYGFLCLTFAAVIISTLAECHPFDHYWQVVPDPGPACRAGVTQLITMGTCDIVTDVVLIVFPIPLVMTSSMPLKKKISLVSLFLLSTVLIAITAYRIPSTIERDASQQYRSLLASLEILAATGVSNAIVIGSFVRDRGVKKAKFRAASIDGSVLDRVQTRSRSVTQNHWGSDEDLVRELGLSVQPSLRHATTRSSAMRPAPIAMPDQPPPRSSNMGRRSTVDTTWNFNKNAKHRNRRGSSGSGSISSTSTDIKLRELDHLLQPESNPVSPGTGRNEPKMGFFDVGGLIDKPSERSPPDSQNQTRQTSPIATPGTNTFLSDVGGLRGQRQGQDDEIRTILPRPSRLEGPVGSRQTEEFREFLRSASPFRQRSAERESRRNSRRILGAVPHTTAPDDLNISDAGGLLK